MIKHFQNWWKPEPRKKPKSVGLATITCPVCKSEKVMEREKNRVGESIIKCQLCDWEFVNRKIVVVKKVVDEDLSEESLATIDRINRRNSEVFEKNKSQRGKERRSKRVIPEGQRPDPFFRLLLAVLIVHTIPVLQLPFSWLETYFHELSHALTTLLTGGSVAQLFLESNGGGMVIVSGGVIGIIAWSGYAGAAIWGVLIYLSALQTKNRNAHGLVVFFIITLTGSTLLWVRDMATFGIMLILYSVFFVSLLLQLKRLQIRWMKFFVQFSGLYVLCNAIYSPLILLNISAANDSITLERVTQIPNHFWVIQWFLLSVFGLYLLWATTFTHNRRIRQRRKV